jgi:hypothetical protein
MKADTSQGLINVEWVHAPELNVTRCVLDVKEEDGTITTLGQGEARVHPEDRYNKKVGRKISLANAIQDYSRPDRTKFWDAYSTMVHGKI